MAYWHTLILFLFLAATAQAQILINPYAYGGAAPTPTPPTYFADERFEGTGYENTWDESGGTGTINEDYTTSPLEGSQSLLLSSTNQHPHTKFVLPSNQDELWIFFSFRIDTALNTTRTIAVARDASGNEMAGVRITATNVLQIWLPNGTTGLTDSPVTGTNYNLWWHIKKGTGADGICSIGFSTGTIEPTSGNSFRSQTNGTNTADFHELQFQITTNTNTNTTGAIVFDKVLISDTGTIGNNPP